MSRVLVVDDFESTCRVMAKLLNSWGHNADCALSGEQALDALGRDRYQVILLDIMMPGIDGLEVLRRIRANPDLADVRVIMYTALDSAHDAQAAMESGALDYLVKGKVSFDQIRSKIDAAVAA